MERCHGGSSGSEADTTSGEGAGNTRDQHSNSVPAEALQNISTRNSDQDTAFRSFYLDHFTSLFGEELQASSPSPFTDYRVLILTHPHTTFLRPILV